MKIKDIQKYLELYNQEQYLFNVIGPIIQKRGFIKFDEFYVIGMWKSARQKQNYIKNKNIVEKITKKAFSIADERDKMSELCKLHGVGIPTASAMLAIVYPEWYGVIDIRCMDMLIDLRLLKSKSTSLNNWLEFLRIMRDLAEENNITPRQVDMILFAMHREKLEKNNYKNLYK